MPTPSDRPRGCPPHAGAAAGEGGRHRPRPGGRGGRAKVRAFKDSLPFRRTVCATMTLRSKVALILVAAIFALLAVATLLRAMDQQRSYMVEQTKQGITLTQTLAELMMKNTGGLGDARTQALAEEYGTSVGVVGVRVVDRSLSVVASSDRDEIGRSYRDPS